MLNKPINVYPYNVCVDADEAFDIEYEIPNNTSLSGAYISIKNFDGKELWSDYKEITDTNQVKSNVIPDINKNGEKELYWNSFYWGTLDTGSYSATLTNTPARTDDSGNAQLGLISSPCALETFTTNCELARDGDTYAGENIYEDISNAICPAPGEREIDWGSVDYGYSSFSDTDAAESYWYENGTARYAVRNPSNKLLNWMKSADVTSGSFALVGKDNSDQIVFFGEIKQFFLARHCEKSWNATMHGSMTDIATYAIFFVSKDVEGKKTAERTLYGRYWYEWGGHTTFGGGRITDFYLTKSIEIWSGFSAACETGDVLYLNGQYRNILSSKEENGETFIIAEPALSDDELSSLYSYQSLGFFETTPDVVNQTQSFYFRYKHSPTLSVINTSEPVTLSEDETEDVVVEPTKEVNDVKCEFGINYESEYKLNYFYLYLMGYDTKKDEWVLLSSSQMLTKTTDTHTFDNLADGQRYAVYSVCYDEDGDEWVSDKYEFQVYNPPESNDYFSISFNKDDMSVDINVDKLTDVFRNVHVDFYKAEISDNKNPLLLKYAGGGYAKMGGEEELENGFIVFNVFRDYNIRNNSKYQYYAKIEYSGRNYDYSGEEDSSSSGVIWARVSEYVKTDFCGSSVMGLKNKSGNIYEISNEFKILYRYAPSDEVITHEISRDYIDTVRGYPYEIKGTQNYISGECIGLLGRTLNGEYIEDPHVGDKWRSFVDSDDIKLYRSSGDVISVISIESSKVTNATYANARIVTEVNFSFKEIASAEDYVIFTTELQEE